MIPTKLTVLNFESAAASGIGQVDVDALLLEKAILELAGVKRWLRADTLFGADGWACRKSGAIAAPFRTALPAQVTAGADFVAANNRAGLKFGAGNTNGALRMLGGLPLDSDYTVIDVGWSPRNASHQVRWGDDQATGSTNFRQVANPNGVDPLQVDHRHEGALICGPVGALKGNAPNIIITSYRKSDKNGVIMVDGVQVGTFRNDRGEILDGNLQIGATGAVGAAVQPLTGGVINEMLILDVPLHLNPAALDLIQNQYLFPRYGVAG